MGLKKGQKRKIESLYRQVSLGELARLVKAPRAKVKDYLKEIGVYDQVGSQRNAEAVVEEGLQYGIEASSLRLSALPWWGYVSLFGAFFLVTFLLYMNTLSNAFVFDDKYVVVNNWLIKEWHHILYIFGYSDAELAYRPLRTMSYVFDYKIFEFKAYGYRLFNMGYHALVGVVVFCCAHVFLRRRIPALIVAGVFLMHPVQTDVVGYISGRRDLLVGLFYFLGFLSFIKAREQRRLAYYVCTVVCYGVGYLAKEMIVSLPALCFLYEVARDGAGKTKIERSVSGFFGVCIDVLKRQAVFYFVMFVLGLGIAYHTVFVASATQYISAARDSVYGVSVTYHGGDLGVALQSVFWLLTNYLYLLFYPVKLLCDYSFNAMPLVYSLFEWRFALSFVVASAFVMGLVTSYRRDVNIFFAMGWFLLTLMPVSQIVPHHELFAIHYLYIPLFSFAYMVGYGYVRKPKKWVLCGIVILFALYGARTVVRNFDWKNELTLYTKNVEAAPESVRSHLNLGRYAAEVEKDFDEAIRRNTIAIEIDQKNPVRSIAHVMYNNLGNIYLETKQYDKSEKAYQAAIQMLPDSTYITNLGVLYSMQGKRKQAIETFQQALQVNPYDPKGYLNLGNQYYLLKQIDKAEEFYRKAISLDAHVVDAHRNLSAILRIKGNHDESRKEMEIVRSIESMLNEQ